MSAKPRYRDIRLLAVVLLLLGILLIAGITQTQTQTTNKPNAVITSEYGKAVFIGNYQLNVSFGAFPDQSSVTIFYSQNTITDKSPNVTVTTQTYVILKNLMIGTYNINILNGTTTPTGLIFTGIVPISSVLEKSNVQYLGNGIFNVSFAKFSGQNNFKVFYAKGNSSMINASSSFVTGTTNNFALIKVNMSNTSLPAISVNEPSVLSDTYSFLVVNDSIFPTNVNLTSYIVTISPNSQSGLFIGFNNYSVFLSVDFLIFVIAVIVVVYVIFKIGKHSGKKNKRE